MESIRTLKRPEPGKRLKVCAYARISNDKRETSIAEQIDYYSDLIFKNEEWEFAGIYADEGISGTSMEARKQFLTMIEKARYGLIDIILVKSISRFARNVLNLLETIQELTLRGVEVFFEKENISTMDPQSTVYLTCWAEFAEEEIKSMSANKRWRDDKNFRDGVYHFNIKQMLGFRLNNNKEPIIYEPEARWIREIFRMYAAGEKTASIAEWLTDNGVKTGKGNAKWSSSSVRCILRNEKYCGDCIMNKRYTVDPISHKTKRNMGERELYIVRDGHPAIVSRELFDKVQKIMDGNIQHFKIKPVNSKEFETDYTRFIYCPYCGSNYFAKKNRHPELLSPTIRKMFYCRSNQSRKLCPESESIYQADLDQIIAKQIGILKSNTKEFRKAIIDAFSKDKKLELESEVKKLESEIAEYRKTLKGITDRTEISVQQLCEHYRWEIKKRSRKKLALENEMLTLVNPETKADSIMAILKDLPFADSADDVDFRKLFCRVIVYSRNKLLFIIGNDNMEKVPNNVQPLFKGTHSYKVRCSTFTTEFGVYINA